MLYFRAIINWHCITGLIVIKTNVVGGTPHNSVYGEAPPERGTFFRPQVYEMVSISMVEVYERVGKQHKILRTKVSINLVVNWLCLCNLAHFYDESKAP